MKVIGVVGGVASGKSLVTDCLARCGASVLNADLVGHEVLREPEVIAALTQRWGPGVLDPNGQIDRRAVARIVFAPGAEAEKAFLESISHPRIAQRLRDQLDAWRKAGNVDVVVLDAAIMLETGWATACDEIWFVDTPAEVRQERAKQRGWTEDQWKAREAAQWPVAKKRAAATRVIDNQGTPEETCRQVRQLLEQVK